MDKIETGLQKKIKEKPKTSYQVLICTTIDNTFHNDKWIELMDGIYSATLKGEEIKALEKHDEVLSIEPDSEIGIL